MSGRIRWVMCIGWGLVACGGGATHSTVLVTDSAGVSIVHNDGERLLEAVSVGSRVFRAEADDLFRVGGVLALSTGDVVVADRSSQSLRYFDATGAVGRVSGGPGEGPGEFRSLLNIFAIRADTIGAYDAGARKVEVFSPSGEHVRTTTLNVVGLIQDVRAFHDGSLSVLLGRFRNLDQLPADVSTVVDTLDHVRVSPLGEILDTLATPAGQIQHVFTFELEDQAVRMPTPYHYSPRALVAVSGADALSGDGSTYEVRRYTAGGLQTISRFGDDRHRTAVTDEAKQELVEARRESYERAASRLIVWRMLSDRLDEVPATEYFPAFGTGRHSILPTPEGGYWVAHFRSRDDVERFDAFSADGRYQATITMPAGFRTWHVTGEAVYGVTFSELDEEFVEAYRIDMP